MEVCIMVSWALISGASTGIGRATASADRLQQESSAKGSGRLETKLLDVTDQASIESAVAHTDKLTGPDGLRVLINNAGIVVPGPLEHVTPADWRRQFDVNLFGAIDLTRATLPLLRRAVASHGRGVQRLLFISSIAGRIAQPMMAPYTCSKFALSALGDSLRLELRRQGIGVTVIEPGAVATDIWAKSDTSASEFTPDHPARKLYEPELYGLLALARKPPAKFFPPNERPMMSYAPYSPTAPPPGFL
jgi:NAD(P)-dependent dehydrogenase (short-subunit alcohol dehydrogenase family)